MKLITLFFLYSSLITAQPLNELLTLVTNKSRAVETATLQWKMEKSREQQLISTLYPQLSLKGKWTDRGLGPLAKQARIDDTSEALYLSADQTLFKGFKEFYGINSEAHRVQEAAYRLEVAKRKILVAFSSAYFTLLLEERREENTQKLIELNSKRERMLLERLRIGKSKNIDLLTAQVQTKQYELSLQESKQKQEQAQLELQDLLAGAFSEEIHPTDVVLPSSLSSLDEYKKQLEEHPQILSGKENFYARGEAKKVFQAEYAPQVWLNGNYWLQNSGPALINPEWDLSIQLSFPFFEGGLTRAKVQEAALSQLSSELELMDTRSMLTRQLLSLYKSIQWRMEQSSLLAEIKQLHLKNYEQMKKEFELGLVGSLDVVTMLNNFTQSLDNYSTNSILLQADYVKLQLMMKGAI
jgi:outer membrane protein